MPPCETDLAGVAAQVVNKELLEVHQAQLMQKESTGLCALLQDDKKDGTLQLCAGFSSHAAADKSPSDLHAELARLYKLYSKLPTGLLPQDDAKYGLTAVSAMVKEHIQDVGDSLVRSQIGQSGGGDEFINQLIALHTKFATLVKECFQDNTLFLKALKEVR
jgi:hypothetical protein